MRKFSTLIAAGLLSTLGLSATAANADTVLRFGNENFAVQIHSDHGRHPYRDHRARWLEPHQVRHILYRDGFRVLSRPDLNHRRNVYVVDAVNRRGRDVRVFVSAYDGRILGVEPYGRGKGWRGRG